MTEREKVRLAVLASILLHLLVLGLLMLWAVLRPPDSHRQKSKDETKQLEVTLVPMPTPTPPLQLAQTTPTPTPTPSPGKVILPKKTLRSYLDTTGLTQTKEAPKNPVFESDHNSQAASELPATGSLPLPSQDGKRRPFADFTNMEYSLGMVTPAPLVNQESDPMPEPTEPKIKESRETQPDMPEPVATPAPLPQNGFGLARPTPVPAKLTPKASPSPAIEQAKATPKPMPPRLEVPKPSYQAHKEATKIEGGISNQGKAGVAAIGTPLGRYNKVISDAVGSRWYYYVNQRGDLVTTGEVRIKFFVNEQGKVQGARVISNTANDSFARYSMQAVAEAQIPPAPPDLLTMLPDGLLEITYNFSLY